MTLSTRGFYGLYICSQWAFIHALLSRVPIALAGLSCTTTRVMRQLLHKTRLSGYQPGRNDSLICWVARDRMQFSHPHICVWEKRSRVTRVGLEDGGWLRQPACRLVSTGRRRPPGMNAKRRRTDGGSRHTRDGQTTGPTRAVCLHASINQSFNLSSVMQITYSNVAGTTRQIALTILP